MSKEFHLLTKPEREKAVQEAAAKLNGRMLAYCHNLLNGLNQTEAYRNAYKEPKKPYNDATARTNSSRLMKDVDVQEYLEIQRQVAVKTAMEKLAYDEKVWLQDQVEAVDKAHGRLPIQKTYKFDDGAKTIKVKEENLMALRGLQTDLGRYLGILNEKPEQNKAAVNFALNLTGEVKPTEKDITPNDPPTS